MDKLLLIDGHSILSRAFYGVPNLTNSEGLHTNAVYGFLNIMFKVLDTEGADHLAVAFDLKDETFRHKMYDEYKGTRKPMPEELHEQVPLMQEVLKAMGVPVLTLPGYEADDILGTIAKQNQSDSVEVTILSGDRDLIQLSDKHIKVSIPKTIKGTTEVIDYYPEDVKNQYHVTPKEFIDVKALMGDASDNIPGVPSIGEKTAISLIETYGSIENVYEHRDEIKPARAKTAITGHYDLAQLSKVLATINTDSPIEYSYDDMKIGDLYTPEAYDYMKRLEFKSILARFDADSVEKPEAKDHFQVIDDISKADEIFKKANESSLTGLSVAGEGDDILALSLCFGEEDTYAFISSDTLTGEYLRDKADSLIRRNAVTSVIDLKSQLPFFTKTGLTKAGEDPDDPYVMDVKIAGYLLNPLKDTYDHDDIARDYLEMNVPSKADLLGKRTVSEALKSQDGKAADLLCYRAYVAYRSYPVLEGKLKETGMWDLYNEIEMPLVYCLYRMERAGMKVEKETLKEYGDQLKIQINELENKIYEEAGEKFNINSPKQLGEVLFEHMKLPHGKKTKTGYSTAADVLEKLAPDYPVVQDILDYRQLTKLNSTYAEGLYGYIEDDGRIHSTFNQTITATGRISSTDPNLQNIPVRMELGRQIRKVFVPDDGCVYVDADYSQIELRILAHMSGDEKLINAYKEAKDIHAVTASEVFHIPLDEVTPLQRRNAKAVNFGIIYGISAFGLSEDLSISRQEAVEYIDKYFETYPDVKRFLDEQVSSAKEKGYVTTMYGRRRPIPELKSSNFAQRSFGERVAMNSPIQGSAADIMKLAMIAVDKELRSRKMKSRIVLQVHDELMIEAVKEEKDEVVDILNDKMKNVAKLRVPLEVETHTGSDWYDAK